MENTFKYRKTLYIKRVCGAIYRNKFPENKIEVLHAQFNTVSVQTSLDWVIKKNY